MTNILDSGVKLVRNVTRYSIGPSSIDGLPGLLAERRKLAIATGSADQVIFLIDEFFESNMSLQNKLGIDSGDIVEFVCTKSEPTTCEIDELTASINSRNVRHPVAIVGIGGGNTMDRAKAVSNLLTNGGRAADYQGWDLVQKPGIFKIGVPTISGTGAEATRTCVMTNPKSGLKLGMNSDFTVFDHVIMDSDLTITVPRDQYFYTGMDAYIHCIEAINGSYRNSIGDAYCRETINLCRQVFLSDDMQSPDNRERLMVASYLGGCAIATSYVGLIHPLSAALSVVFGIHHCLANCIAMKAAEDFYPDAFLEFWEMSRKQNILIPSNICSNLDNETYQKLYKATMMHQKPLTNALGEKYKSILSFEKVVGLFERM